MDHVSTVINEMEKYASHYHIPIIKPNSAKLLVKIVKQTSPKRILEIGTAIGYSTILMAAAMPENCIIISIEYDAERVKLAHHFINQTDQHNRIQIIHGDAADVIDTLEGHFDLVFIDAAKGQYPKYLNKIKSKIIPGTVIIADNILFRNMVNATQPPPKRFRTIVRRLQEYVSYVTTSKSFRTTIYHLEDGVAVSYYQGVQYDEET